MQNYHIAEDILNVLKLPKQKKKETLDDFKNRLIHAIDKINDAEFNQLEPTTQAWIESCIDVLLADAEGKLPPFTEESTQSRESDPTVVDSTPGVRIRQRRTAALNRKPKSEGSQWHMKGLVGKNPNINHIALRGEVAKLGFAVTKSTCYAILSNFRQSMKVLQSLDMLNSYTPPATEV